MIELRPSPAHDVSRRVARYGPGAHIEANDGRDMLAVVVSGWGCEMRVLPDGRRQIFSILLPGDHICVRASDNLASVAFVALTHLEISDVAPAPGEAQTLSQSQELIDVLQRQNERQLDHMVRLGSMSASQRLIHFLLELHGRLSAIGLVDQDGFRIPLTQELFASVLGASVVHVNRTLKELRRDGFITLRSGSVTLHDVPRLSAIAGYDPRRTA